MQLLSSAHAGSVSPADSSNISTWGQSWVERRKQSKPAIPWGWASEGWQGDSDRTRASESGCMGQQAQAHTRNCSLPPAWLPAGRAADSPLTSPHALGRMVTGLLGCIHPRTRCYVCKRPPFPYAQALPHRLSPTGPSQAVVAGEGDTGWQAAPLAPLQCGTQWGLITACQRACCIFPPFLFAC